MEKNTQEKQTDKKPSLVVIITTNKIIQNVRNWKALKQIDGIRSDKVQQQAGGYMKLEVSLHCD